jgi:hypothetical protein
MRPEKDDPSTAIAQLAKPVSRAFNGKHRTARVAKFNGALERKRRGRNAQRKMKQASQRRNRNG